MSPDLAPERLFSSDSHVIEPVEIWDGLIERKAWKAETSQFKVHPGGSDPYARMTAMVEDGVVGEILYPTYGMALFAIEDPALQEACCHRYNEWLAQYCAAAPEKLFGIGMIPTYTMEAALRELEYCIENKMAGTIIWQSPHPDLGFGTTHYDPFWKASVEAKLPCSLHILTGYNYSRGFMLEGPTSQEPVDPAAPRPVNTMMFQSVRQKLDCVIDTTADILFSDTFVRFPELRIVLVENEVGWMPFIVDQWDYYARGKREADDPTLEQRKWPSDFVRENIFVTYFRDPLVGRLASGWGVHNWMWSNDFPHPNSTWPHSRKTVAEQVVGLDQRLVENLIWRNGLNLYNLTDQLAGEFQS
jgi:predicted TIM-barrel fold metal-dependent hydrolase